MDKNHVYRLFKNIIEKGDVLIHEPMSKHTSFKIGGPVDVLVLPGSIEELASSIKLCKSEGLDYFVMGNGSNIIVRDKGIRGIVIKISESLNNIIIEGTKLIAEAGALLSVVSKSALRSSLTGLEFASGIPGSLGGAIAMNAGAYGGEMKDVVTKVKCVDENGNFVEYENSDMEFGYRQSRIQNEKLIVVQVEMKLKEGNYEDIRAYTNELTEKRTSKQPLHLPSAGSTFRRPEGYFAGKLIEDAGLKGLILGGAQVSDKHCGFIVNIGNATADDVINLIRVVQKTVSDKYGVKLETEVKIIGEE
ncbi:UDP-N-acetylmuramate dehydrogenase [Proteiniborus ethanoligenes]|uniref:UDP-N-acetylenolpyruvoylglucosamine reductase n=1 Tax=Proteiniborus ethanoligenes TaxID=415015 RepID=A0A1H3R7Y0_9FIRM|nr:UDP-N-acetylmuramate dehydrogenase [Proteiniborus ethanoligenes]SDZ21338.1 UDP-N-acetylmuramate dehydrogenase [Proteiniborus ethanoligenes]